MNTPKISVIVPVYNVEQYLPRCIDSILAQTFTDFELLLIDDGSPDNSGKICDEYAEKDSRIRVFHKENGGVSSARNVGLDNAQGEWIAFVDADDYLNKDYIMSFISNKMSNDTLIVQGCTCINGKDTTSYKYENKTYRKEDIVKFVEEEEMYKHGSPYGKLYSNKIVKTYNISFDERLHNYEDFLFFIDYIKYVKEVRLISATSYNYVIYQTGLHNKLFHFTTEELLLESYMYKTKDFTSKKIDSYALILFFRVLKSIYMSCDSCKTKKVLKTISCKYNSIFTYDSFYIGGMKRMLVLLLKRKMYVVVDSLFRICYKNCK